MLAAGRAPGVLSRGPGHSPGRIRDPRDGPAAGRGCPGARRSEAPARFAGFDVPGGPGLQELGAGPRVLAALAQYTRRYSNTVSISPTTSATAISAMISERVGETRTPPDSTAGAEGGASGN